MKDDKSASPHEADLEEQMQAYSNAVRSGMYAKRSGLLGKYDNIRLYWEDEITRAFLRPHLQKVIEKRQNEMRRIRILDLGCGSADGYELLAGIRHRDADLQCTEVDLINPTVLGLYKGIDLNQDLLDQARSVYYDNPKMVFEKGDFSEGLPLDESEKPYDLYFTSYGTCSHFNDDENAVKLLADIARRTRDYSLIMCDWLGRYSYEWQTLWTNDLSEVRNMEYLVNYIFDREEREHHTDKVESLWLRLMSRKEAEDIVARASEMSGVEIRPLVFFDRSVFTGRHMDTGEYNPYVQPLREAVNCLHENNMRTDFNTLYINYVLKQEFRFLNDYFEHIQVCWNTLVHYVDQLLHTYNEKNRSFDFDPPPIPASYPVPLQEGMERMRMVVEGVGWLVAGLPRENIIEPQLGYTLRHLVTSLQQGLGCAHSLVGILEVNKEG